MKVIHHSNTQRTLKSTAKVLSLDEHTIQLVDELQLMLAAEANKYVPATRIIKAAISLLSERPQEEISKLVRNVW